MVIEKVHGLQATGMTMDQRFTLLAAAAPDRVIRQKRRPTAPFLNQTFNNRNRNLIEEIARQLGYHQQKQNMWGGMGAGLRRYGSEGSLAAPRRAPSVNSQPRSVRSRLTWRPNNNIRFRNRSRSVSVSSVPGSRGPRWRNIQQRLRYRNFRGQFQANGGGMRGFRRRAGAGAKARPGVRRGGRGGGQQRGAARGRGRGRGARANRGGGGGGAAEALPTREQLDAQLDHYMAGTKAALDKELDDYMKDAMDLDGLV